MPQLNGGQTLPIRSKEMANFLNHAKGPARELRTRPYIGIDVGFTGREQGKAMGKEAEQISRMLHALIRTTRSRP